MEELASLRHLLILGDDSDASQSKEPATYSVMYLDQKR